MSVSSQTGEYPKINARTTLDELIQNIASSASAPPPKPPDASSAASANLAVARCCQAYTLALKNSTGYAAEREAARAYRNAMPPLVGSRNIRDFIACTAHGMLIQAIDGADGSRLLHAARVASTAHKAHTRKKSNSAATSAPKTQENEHLAHQISPVTKAE